MKQLISIFLFMSICISCSTKNNEPSLKTEIIKPKKDLSHLKKATFAGGCFWCEEGIFENVKGVEEAVSGYSGGDAENPSYQWVSSGKTGHAESVEVYYDSSLVSYEQLLKIYFASEDPTQVNGQGIDNGTQYRSIIFYRNETEKKLAEKYITDLNASGKYDDPIVVQLLPSQKFWEAEDYHQNFIQYYPDNSYVQRESLPRIQKARDQFPELMKKEKKRY